MKGGLEVFQLMTDDLFDRYRILRRDDGELWELDRSRSFATFKALDISLEMTVALTIADAELLTTDEQLHAFKLRARELMQVERDGIARILSAGINGNRCYYLTQFVIGESVHHHVQRRGAVAWEDALRVVMHVIHALEHAREHNIRHAGITPKRIILGDPGWNKSTPDVQVVGFDLFGRMHDEVSGEVVPTYASEGPPPDRSAIALAESRDIKALGRVLELMLTGHYPAATESTRNTSGFDGAPYRPTPINIPVFVQNFLQRMLADNVGGDHPLTYSTVRWEIEWLLAERRELLDLTRAVRSVSGTDALLMPGLNDNNPLNGERSVALDENIQFTAYRPKVVAPGKWTTMLVFAHLDERPSWMDEDELAPIEEMERQAKQILGVRANDYRNSTSDSALAVPRDGEITLVPDIGGFEFNPPRRSFLWKDGIAVHSESFSMRAPTALNGQVSRGRLTIFLGHVILAEISLAIRVDTTFVPARNAVAGNEAMRAHSSARPFRRVFASYSHDDVAVVETIEKHARTLGDEYLRDWVNLRSGEQWNERLLSMINEADVFQLFWSKHASNSPYVTQEWRHALALGRPAFVRPTYWEDPMPQPPAELRGIHFHRLTADVSTRPISPVEPPPVHAEPSVGHVMLPPVDNRTVGLAANSTPVVLFGLGWRTIVVVLIVIGAVLGVLLR